MGLNESVELGHLASGQIIDRTDDHDFAIFLELREHFASTADVSHSLANIGFNPRIHKLTVSQSTEYEVLVSSVSRATKKKNFTVTKDVSLKKGTGRKKTAM